MRGQAHLFALADQRAVGDQRLDDQVEEALILGDASPQRLARHPDRYQVHALGFTASLVLPQRRVQIATRYFHEFAARSTFQGYSFQVSGSVNF